MINPYAYSYIIASRLEREVVHRRRVKEVKPRLRVPPKD